MSRSVFRPESPESEKPMSVSPIFSALAAEAEVKTDRERVFLPPANVFPSFFQTFHPDINLENHHPPEHRLGPDGTEFWRACHNNHETDLNSFLEHAVKICDRHVNAFLIPIFEIANVKVFDTHHNPLAGFYEGALTLVRRFITLGSAVATAHHIDYLVQFVSLHIRTAIFLYGQPGSEDTLVAFFRSATEIERHFETSPPPPPYRHFFAAIDRCLAWTLRCVLLDTGEIHPILPPKGKGQVITRIGVTATKILYEKTPEFVANFEDLAIAMDVANNCGRCEINSRVNEEAPPSKFAVEFQSALHSEMNTALGRFDNLYISSPLFVLQNASVISMIDNILVEEADAFSEFFFAEGDDTRTELLSIKIRHMALEKLYRDAEGWLLSLKLSSERLFFLYILSTTVSFRAIIRCNVINFIPARALDLQNTLEWDATPQYATADNTHHFRDARVTLATYLDTFNDINRFVHTGRQGSLLAIEKEDVEKARDHVLKQLMNCYVVNSQDGGFFHIVDVIWESIRTSLRKPEEIKCTHTQKCNCLQMARILRSYHAALSDAAIVLEFLTLRASMMTSNNDLGILEQDFALSFHKSMSHKITEIERCVQTFRTVRQEAEAATRALLGLLDALKTFGVRFIRLKKSPHSAPKTTLSNRSMPRPTRTPATSPNRSEPRAAGTPAAAPATSVQDPGRQAWIVADS